VTPRTPRTGRRASGRRVEILRTAARLFAERGYNGTSIDDIGAAVGVSGPALYWHFANKDALLAEMLEEVSDRLLVGAAECVQGADGPLDALDRLVEAQVRFAFSEPFLITVHERELDRLEPEARRRVRRSQRLYVEEWVKVLGALRPAVPDVRLRAAVHAAIGLMNATPHIPMGDDRATVEQMVGTMARAALLSVA
jgi:AcrR family transcriptional regulator